MVCSKMFHLFQSSIIASLFMLQIASVISRCYICFHTYIVSVCPKCFTCFRCILQVFYFDVTYVAVVIHILQTYVLIVLPCFSMLEQVLLPIYSISRASTRYKAPLHHQAWSPKACSRLNTCACVLFSLSLSLSH
jgi:hypothetical protein